MFSLFKVLPRRANLDFSPAQFQERMVRELLFASMLGSQGSAEGGRQYFWDMRKEELDIGVDLEPVN